MLKFRLINQLIGRAPRCHAAICLLLIACCGPPAFGIELPDTSKPTGMEPGQQLLPPRPVPAPEVMPRREPPALAEEKGNQARVQVNRIELTGVVDRPELGILRAQVEAHVEALRQQKVREGQQKLLQLLQLEDLEDTSNLLKEIEKIARDTVNEADRRILESTIAQLRARQPVEETLSLQQLQEIAAALAQYYRERGFILVQAFIPPQTISQGSVRIRVLEGILGHVTVERKRYYTEDQLLEPFQVLLGQPVTAARIEEAMLLLNDYPGLKTFAVFRPGIFTGETDLLVTVLEEDRVSANLHVDNYGSKFTGETRGRYDLFVNNPFRLNDRLIASVSQNFNPNNGHYLGLTYEKRAFGAKNVFGFNLSSNEYELGDSLEPFGITGETLQAGVSWRHSFHRGRLSNTYGLFEFNRKSAKMDITDARDRSDDLSVLSAEFGRNWTDALNQNAGNARVRISQGLSGVLGSMEPTNDATIATASRRGGSGEYASSDFTKYEAGLHYWLSLQQDRLLHLSLQAQYSSDLLTSLEQMPLGGPSSVRAYPASEYLRDSAYAASVEWIVRAPGFADEDAFGNKRWGEILDAVLFADYAKGWINDPLGSEEEEIDLAGVGAGLRFHYKDVTARFEFATPLTSREPSNDKDPQYYFELNIGF